MKLSTLIFTAALALAGSAFGATPPPPAGTNAGPGAQHMGPCEKDPSKCQADAAKFDNWCAANAQQCVNLKAWAEKRIERCEANKQKCEEMKQKMMQKHQEHEQLCQQDPNTPHCHAMRANNQPNDNEEPSDDEAPPPPPM